MNRSRSITFYIIAVIYFVVVTVGILTITRFIYDIFIGIFDDKVISFYASSFIGSLLYFLCFTGDYISRLFKE